MLGLKFPWKVKFLWFGLKVSNEFQKTGDFESTERRRGREERLKGFFSDKDNFPSFPQGLELRN